MATTFKTSSKIKRPVVVSVPVARDSGSLSVKDAEAIIRNAGGRPMTEAEVERFRVFKKSENES
jgi:hypothetical protein